MTAIDEAEEALGRLGEDWPGGSSSATAWTSKVLREAGIEDADAVVVATNGDNTNIVVGQVAQKRFGIECTVVRVLDPARAEFYATLGLRVVWPTSSAIEVLTEAVKSCAVRPHEEAAWLDVRPRRGRRQGRARTSRGLCSERATRSR